MTTVSTILIDDSQSSIDALRLKLEKHCPQVKILQTCTDSREAINAIGLLKPQVIFLDVEMPTMNGFALLQQVPVIDFDIIFVTAYHHYAIPAIRISAFDYLEKPVNVKLLKEAVERLCRKIEERKTQRAEEQASISRLIDSIRNIHYNPPSLALPSGDGIVLVTLKEIVWLEAVNNYTRFYLADERKILVSKTIGDYETRLASYEFVRIHRSHIINLHFLHRYHRDDGGYVEMKNGIRLEVAIRKRQELLERLKQMG